MMYNRKKPTGFSLVELVIVIVIIGVIAAIAVPRISRGAAGAGAAALRADLYVLRNAIDLYAAEHGNAYPTVAGFEAQLTTYTDDTAAGSPQAAKDATHFYGPYLVAVPMLKVGEGPAHGKGSNSLGPASVAGVGWVYEETTGKIFGNADTATDESGTPYKEY